MMEELGKKARHLTMTPKLSLNVSKPLSEGSNLKMFLGTHSPDLLRRYICRTHA